MMVGNYRKLKFRSKTHSAHRRQTEETGEDFELVGRSESRTWAKEARQDL